MSAPPVSMPVRGARLLSAVLDGEEVVYDPVRREAHLLNPTASMLLGRCDGRTSIDRLVADLQGAYGADPEAIERDVRAALADFRQRQLVGPEPAADDVPAVPRPQPELAPAADPLVLPEAWSVVSPVIHALDARLRVRSDEPTVGRYVEQVLAPLLAEVDRPGRRHRAGPHPEHTFDVVTGGPGPIRLLLDGEEVGASTTLDGAMSYLQWSINQLAVDEADSMVLLHASAVRAGDRVAIFPAASNSGKSTLAAGMVRSGLGYLTDEAVAIDLTTSGLTAYPKPISLDPGSWGLFADLEPHLDDAPERLFVNEWQLDPCVLHPDALLGHPATRIALVAFPTYVAGGPTAFESLSRAEGLLLMLQNSFNMTTALGPGLAVLAGIAASVRVVRLTVGDLDEAVDLIRTTLHQNRDSVDRVH